MKNNSDFVFKQVDLTIIVPHYNSAETLERLIKSIGRHGNIQIIVIDDNSNKNIELLMEVKTKYSDIAEFYNNSTGIQSAGACRNIGIEKAHGTWIVFADADDFFVDNWYEVVSSYFMSDYDSVYFTPTSVFDDGETIGVRHIGQQAVIYEYLNCPSRENYMQLARIHSVWSKMFRREVFERYNCICSETMHANDIFISKKLFYYCQNKKITSEVIYCITHTKGSLTTIQSDKAFYERLEEFVKSYKFLESHYEKKDFEHIRISGGRILYDAYKGGVGINKIVKGLFYLKKNKVRTIAKEYMSLTRFYNAYKRVALVYKNKKKRVQ